MKRNHNIYSTKLYIEFWFLVVINVSSTFWCPHSTLYTMQSLLMQRVRTLIHWINVLVPLSAIRYFVPIVISDHWSHCDQYSRRMRFSIERKKKGEEKKNDNFIACTKFICCKLKTKCVNHPPTDQPVHWCLITNFVEPISCRFGMWTNVYRYR